MSARVDELLAMTDEQLAKMAAEAIGCVADREDLIHTAGLRLFRMEYGLPTLVFVDRPGMTRTLERFDPAADLNHAWQFAGFIAGRSGSYVVTRADDGGALGFVDRDPTNSATPAHFAGHVSPARALTVAALVAWEGSRE